MPSAYLDTNAQIYLVSGNAKPAEQSALVELLRRRKAAEIDLVTSPIAEEELQAYATGWSPAEEAIYLLLDDVPKVDESFQMLSMFGGGPLGSMPFGGGITVHHEVLGMLIALLPDERDARHLFQAAQNGIDYFVTCDERSILRHTAAIEALVPIRPRSPSQLLLEL
jgi:predicted nucleic acid-binding protein